MSSTYIFNYLRDSYSFLPKKDRELLGETWRAYEQVVGNLYNKSIEFDFNATTTRLLAFNNERWCSYAFDPSTKIDRPASYLSPLDLTGGVNLSVKYLLKFYTETDGPFEIDLRGADPLRTTGAEIATKINAAIGYNFATVLDTGALYFSTAAIGTSAFIEFSQTSNPALNASELVIGILATDMPQRFPKFPYVYNLQDSAIVSIPTLQNSVRDENITSTLVENTDYEIESGAITFLQIPLAKMWAKNTSINRETPYNNFGYLLNFYDTNSEQYLETLKGIWYAFWVGPRPNNIKRALYLLFGLPTARQTGTVKDIRKGVVKFQQDLFVLGDSLGTIIDLEIPLSETVAVAAGQLLPAGAPYTNNILTVTPMSGTVISTSRAAIDFRQDSDFGAFESGPLVTYDIPFGLHTVVQINQRMKRFDPFTDGIKVIDHVNYPGYFPIEVGREGLRDYLTESAVLGTAPDTDESKALITAELSTFLVQISSDAFISRTINIANVKNFLSSIRPMSKTFLFQLLVSVDDTIQTDEKLSINVNFDVTPKVDYNPWLEADPDALDAGETTEDLGLQLDSEVFGDNELCDVDVYHDASTVPVLIETFTF